MLWVVGKDNRHRATLGEWEAEISYTAGRAKWKVVIFKVGVGRVAVIQPFATMRGARKRGETELRKREDAKAKDNESEQERIRFH